MWKALTVLSRYDQGSSNDMTINKDFDFMNTEGMSVSAVLDRQERDEKRE